MSEQEASMADQQAPVADDVAGGVAVNGDTVNGDAAARDAAGAEVVPEAEAEAEAVHEPIETRTTYEVGLVRTVRYGPIMIAGAVLVAMFAFIATFFFPVEEGADYTVGQVAGFVAVVGAAIGLALGGLLALVLNLFAKRRTGAAVAVLTTVR